MIETKVNEIETMTRRRGYLVEVKGDTSSSFVDIFDAVNAAVRSSQHDEGMIFVTSLSIVAINGEAHGTAILETAAIQ